MKLPVKKGYLLILIPAFFAYFYSESVLRQGAVSSIDPKKFNIDSIIAELPGSVRDGISYNIHYGQLQDAIRQAGNDKERAFAISNMADFIKEPDKRVELFEEVLTRYPANAESARAYTFFLNNPDTKMKVSVVQFQKYVMRFSIIDQYYIWTIGLAKLRSLNVSDQEILDYLLPLTTLDPQYRDYSGLFKQLGEVAAKLNNKDIYGKAIKAEEKCYELPLLEVALMEQLQNKTPEKPQKQPLK